MESLQLLMGGFGTALQPTNLLFAFAGCFLGTLIGVLPGIGPAAGTAILIPVTFAMEPTPAIIMLAAIYYGAMYGGTITSVLINTPGEAATAITCVDGYQMAKAGRAGAALAVAAIGSFVGASFSMVALVFLALPLTALAIKFGPPEIFSLMVLGLSLVTSLAGKSILKALAAAAIGMLLAMVGMDPVSGVPRFAYGRPELLDGFGIVPVVMGLFGIGEILINAEVGVRQVFDAKMSALVPTWKDLRDSAGSIARGTVIGFFLGIIPGVGGVVASFVSYVAEKKASKYPQKFGTGVIEGVAGPETANNAHSIAALIPLFTLGIPSSATVAIIMGAFMMNGLIPGPALFKSHSEIVWGIIASLYVGNLILLVLNLPLIPMWVAVLRIPYSVLFALILLFCVVGAYSLGNNVFDIAAMIGFGVIGYLAKKLDFPVAPAVLTLVLGKMMERAVRQSLELSDGDFSIFLGRPISAILLAAAVVIVISSVAGLTSRVQGEAEI